MNVYLTGRGSGSGSRGRVTGRLMPSFTTRVMGGLLDSRLYWRSMPPSDDFVYDPTRSDFQANAHAIYRVLRDEYPVYENRETGIWALSRFADVRDAATDTAV